MSPLKADRAERFVLGACLASPAIYWKIAGQVKGRMFGDPFLRRAFEAIESLAAEHREPKVDLVARRMSDDENDIDPRTMLLALVAGVRDELYLVGDFVADIVDAHIRRRLASTAKEIAKKAADVDVSPTTLLAEAEAGIAEIAAVQGGGRESFGAVVDRVVDEVFRAYEHREQPGIGTGLATLDELIGRLRPALYFLGGDPGGGKTAMAMQVALHVAGTGKRVAFFALDQEADAVVLRILARQAGLTTKKLTGAHLDEDALTRLYDTSRWARALPLEILSGSHTIGDIRQTCVGMANSGGLDLVVIDHLREIEHRGRAADEIHHAGVHCHELKRLKSDLKVPVLCLAHRKVSAMERDNPRPRDGDLWGGGAPEKTADAVFYVWRPAENDRWKARERAQAERRGDPDPDSAIRFREGKAEVIATKLRMDRAPQHRWLLWRGETTTYEDMDREP